VLERAHHIRNVPEQASKKRYPMLRIEIDREEDGRWVAEALDLPGIMTYGASEAEARTKVQALALRVIADRIEHGEPVPFSPGHLFIEA
jgi:predicted RNase H-like HicB family nuclease